MSPELNKKFVVDEGNVHERLDVFVSRQGLELSRSQIQKLIAKRKVSVNERFLKPSYKLGLGDVVLVVVGGDENEGLVPEKIPLDILYEDDEVLVVNKNAGMVVHPVDFSQKGPLVHALLGHTRKLSTVNGSLRPGIVHRLDKDTSGALIVAKTDSSHVHIVEQIKKRKVRRRYKTIVLGRVEPEKGRIVAPVGRHVVSRQRMSVRYVGGKEAITNYKVIEEFQTGDMFFSLLDISLETGRTHQIRVHLASLGHPVVGDETYGKKIPRILIKRQALHAEHLGFLHPATGEYMEFTAPLPEDRVKQIEELRELRSPDQKRG